jgi:hypothetical protein
MQKQNQPQSSLERLLGNSWIEPSRGGWLFIARLGGVSVAQKKQQMKSCFMRFCEIGESVKGGHLLAASDENHRPYRTCTAVAVSSVE